MFAKFNWDIEHFIDSKVRLVSKERLISLNQCVIAKTHNKILNKNFGQKN